MSRYALKPHAQNRPFTDEGVVNQDDPRRETLRELLLLRSEYEEQLRGDLTRDDLDRVRRMIRKLTACIERTEQELRAKGPRANR